MSIGLFSIVIFGKYWYLKYLFKLLLIYVPTCLLMRQHSVNIFVNIIVVVNICISFSSIFRLVFPGILFSINISLILTFQIFYQEWEVARQRKEKGEAGEKKDK